MKCDDFLPALETGGMIGRLQAAAHARRCQQCAAVRAKFEIAKRQWTDASVVTPGQREMWQRAAIAEPRMAPSRSRRSRAQKWAMATGMTMVIVITLVLTRWSRSPSETEMAQRPPLSTTPPNEVSQLSSVQQPRDQAAIDTVERALDELAVELKKLQDQADLIDARHDVDELLSTYRPLGSSEPSPQKSP